jgi:hypothetical protein
MELVGVRNGPVRATRKVRLGIDLGTFFPELPSGIIATHHYRSAFITPSRVSIPWLVLKLAREFTFENLTDFRSIARGMRYWDAAHPEGLEFAETGERIFSSSDHEWWVASGDAGTFLQAFQIPTEWKEWGVVRGTVFLDGPTKETDEPKATGPHAAGYSLKNATDIRKGGEYLLHMATVVLPERYQLGDEAGPLAMLHQPLETHVRTLR